MMAPPDRSPGRTALVVSTALTRFAPRFARQAAAMSSRSASWPAGRVKSVFPPAMLTSTSRLAPTSPAIRVTCPGSVASQVMARAPISAAVPASRPASRPVMITVSPAALNRAATALPSPLPPPVTSTIRLTAAPFHWYV